MNLTKLFETQQVLRNKIGYEGPDRLEKLILALLVEVGECANEWRGFKFWSKNQEPRTINDIDYYKCEECFLNSKYKNPLLEEFVDGLHFILEIGLVIRETDFTPIRLMSLTNNITQQFNTIFNLITKIDLMILLMDAKGYRVLFNNYLLLGEMLGFTWEQVEQAYFEKNKVNHDRQENGY